MKQGSNSSTSPTIGDRPLSIQWFKSQHHGIKAYTNPNTPPSRHSLSLLRSASTSPLLYPLDPAHYISLHCLLGL